jgi:predicted nucleic acid-binding protein
VSSAFIDTNVLLYLLASDEAKADRAEQILSDGGVVSVQVLNEFAHVARRKFQAPWSAVEASLQAIMAFSSVEALTIETHELGLVISKRYDVSIFDGQLLAAARLANCDVFYSEDMQHGQNVTTGLVIRNPFLSPPGTP